MVGWVAGLDRGEPDERHVRVFGIRALADPQSLPRVLDPFAQRSIVPRQVCCRRAGDIVLIDIEVEAGHRATHDLILMTLRELPVVERANLMDPYR